LLLVACDDGSVKIFRDFAVEANSSDDECGSEDGESDLGSNSGEIVHKTRLVSAWNGIKDVTSMTAGHRNVSANVNSGKSLLQHPVKTAWSQPDLTLAVGGGDSRYIRLWDANQELRRADLLTGTDAAISRLSFGPSHLGLLCAGFVDGSVRLYDVRSPESHVMTFDGQDGSAVLDCRIKGDEQRLPVVVSGDAAGNVQYYELRAPHSSTRSVRLANIAVAPPGQTLNGLILHPRSDIIAVWAQQSVNLHYFNPSGSHTASSIVNVIKYHDEGVLGQRLGLEGCLAFHPYLLQVAIGSKDGPVSLKGFRKI
jgi:WD40 repeat protein